MHIFLPLCQHYHTSWSPLGQSLVCVSVLAEASFGSQSPLWWHWSVLVNPQWSAWPHSHTDSQTHTRTPTHTHMHKHAHPHTHTHTHTQCINRTNKRETPFRPQVCEEFWEWMQTESTFSLFLHCLGDRRVCGTAREGVCSSESSTWSSQDPPPPCWTGWADPAGLWIWSRSFCTEEERRLRGCRQLGAGSRRCRGQKEGYNHR